MEFRGAWMGSGNVQIHHRILILGVMFDGSIVGGNGHRRWIWKYDGRNHKPGAQNFEWMIWARFASDPNGKRE